MMLSWETYPILRLKKRFSHNSFPFVLNRNKTTMPVLEEMLPPDLLDYCRQHQLLDSILMDHEANDQMLVAANNF